MEMSVTGGFEVWNTVLSWCTPTVLFVLVNIVIGTIAISSRMLGNNNNNENPNVLMRQPSLLTRFSSMTFNRKAYDLPEVQTWNEPQEGVAEDNVVFREEEKEEVKMIEEKKRSSRGKASTGLSQRTGNVKSVNNGLGRSKSDTAPLLDLHPPPPPLPGTIKKSETFELSNSHSHSHENDVVAEEQRIDDIVERFHEASGAAGSSTDGVDAKADDFINKFKQQLKLQRLESLMRYKETLNRKI